MAVYSWQLALVTSSSSSRCSPLLRALQRRQLAAYDEVRNAVGGTLSEVSELVERRRRSSTPTASRTAPAAGSTAPSAPSTGPRCARRSGSPIMFPLADLFGALAPRRGRGVGATQGPGWGLGLGDLIGFVFLVNLLLTPDLASSARSSTRPRPPSPAGARSWACSPRRSTSRSPRAASTLPSGALPVRLDAVRFAYRDGGEVLRGHRPRPPRRHHRRRRGRDGLGEDHVAKLLCRLADPTAGRVIIGGVDLREVDPDQPPPRDPARAPGRLPVRRVARRQRAPGAGRRATTTTVAAAFDTLGLGGVGGRPARRAPRGGRRARRQPVRRRAPARRAGPGAAR